MGLLTATEMIRTGPAGLVERWKVEIVRSGHRLTTKTRKVAAYVNHGRLIADCPDCNSGIALHPTVDRAGCVDCGAIWPVVFPAELEAIAAVLEVRPMAHRHWTPSETVADLQAENVEHAGELI